LSASGFSLPAEIGKGWPHASFPRPALFETFAVFPLLGFSMNTVALCLVLAIGLVVDDGLNRESFAHDVSFANKEATSFEDVKGNIDTR
jgi:hypothetical protein